MTRMKRRMINHQHRAFGQRLTEGINPGNHPIAVDRRLKRPGLQLLFAA